MIIELHHHPDAATSRRLDEILQRVTALQTKGEEMAADLTRLRADIARNADLLKSAQTTLSGIAQALRDALTGPNPQADINALADQLESDDAGLAAAIAENTNTPATPPTAGTPA